LNHEFLIGIIMVCVSALFGFAVGVTKADVKFLDFLDKHLRGIEK